MKQQGIHPVFHSSLLWIHVLNDDRLFPGHLETQVADFSEPELEWAVDKVLTHYGTSKDAMFEMRWTTGDVTWLSYDQISHLDALDEYLKLQDVEGIKSLPRGAGMPPHDSPQSFNEDGGPEIRMFTEVDPYDQLVPSTCPEPDQTILFGDEHGEVEALEAETVTQLHQNTRAAEQVMARRKKCDAASGCIAFPSQGPAVTPSTQGTGNLSNGWKHKGRERQERVEEPPVGEGSTVRGAGLERDVADVEFNEHMDWDIEASLAAAGIVISP
ncbi:hypothetical protein BDN67DRAFT_985645 [Paxillus ammoniavirescens]|nr:hypothetical protein BDN67DRAFT_985645 [Paxillus ammoniavirescens]